jgi:preprotein translocase subunit YajC
MMREVTTMSLFIVAFMVITAVGMFFWLMMRPTADEEGSAVPPRNRHNQ